MRTLLALALSSTTLIANTLTWISSSNTDWNTPTNWEPSGIPGTSTHVQFIGGSTSVFSIATGTAGGTAKSMAFSGGTAFTLSSGVWPVPTLNLFPQGGTALETATSGAGVYLGVDLACVFNQSGTIALSNGTLTLAGRMYGDGVDMSVLGPGLLQVNSDFAGYSSTVARNLTLMDATITNISQFAVGITGSLTLQGDTNLTNSNQIGPCALVMQGGEMALNTSGALNISGNSLLSGGSITGDGVIYVSGTLSSAIPISSKAIDLLNPAHMSSTGSITVSDYLILGRTAKDGDVIEFTSSGSVYGDVYVIYGRPTGTPTAVFTNTGYVKGTIELNQWADVYLDVEEEKSPTAYLNTSGVVDGNVEVYGIAYATVTGLVNGYIHVQNPNLTLAGGAICEQMSLGSSVLSLNINGASMDSFTITGPSGLYLWGNETLNISSLTHPPRGSTSYTFLTFGTVIGGGSFGSITYPTGYGDIFSVVLGTTSAILYANFAESSSIPIPNSNQASGGAIQAVTLMNEAVASGNCSPETPLVSDIILGLEGEAQIRAMNELSPQYKVIQFGLEKLQFLLQRELEVSLYSFDRGTKPFVIAGYDNLEQKSAHLNNGYRVSTYYQMLGLTQGWDKAQGLLAIGASESTLKLIAPASLHLGSIGSSTYNTVYGTLGLSAQDECWVYGLKALYGYSFLETGRHINFLSAKAKSDHGAWNVSVEGHLAYRYKPDAWLFEVYDTPGYIYGCENNYTEKGAPGVNWHVKEEKISLIRNAVGFLFDGPIDFSKKADIHFFTDLSWVYEHYLISNIYYTAYVGSTLYAPFNQTIPAENYGRLAIGFKSQGEKLGWSISYLGLYGSKFIEQSGSIKLNYKY